jgi:hypothetical protein
MQTHGGPVEENSRGEARGRRRSGVKVAKLPRSLIYTRGAMVVGTVGVLRYPDHFCSGLPHGSVTWGGGSNNRATRRIMAVIAMVINSNYHTVNRHFM